MASVEWPWAWHLNRANTSWHYKRGRKWPIEETELVWQQKQEKQKANMQQIQEKERVLQQKKEKVEANMQQTQKREQVLQQKREKHEANMQQMEKQEQALQQRKEKQEANMRQTQEKEQVLQQKKEKQNLTMEQIEKEQVLQQRREKQEAHIRQIEEKEQALQQRRQKQEASLQQIEEQEQAVQQRREKQEANIQRMEKQEQALQQRREKLAANMQKMQKKEQALQQKKEKKQANCHGVFKNAARVSSSEADMREIEEKERVLQQKREEQEVNMRQIEEKEQALQQRAFALQKEEHELMQKFNELQDQKGELERNLRELQDLRDPKVEEKELPEGRAAGNKSPMAEEECETLQSELQDLKSVVLGLQQTVARITSDMEDDASGSDSSGTSSGTSDSWMVVGSEKPCCFLPDTHFNVLTDVGPVLCPASMLHQGARVQAANGKVVEVVNPPEQHQVDSVIELKAGDGSLIVSLDHRILVPGNKTVKAGDLSKGDEVILDGMPARLSSCVQKSGPALVLRIGFKPDLPVAAVMPPSSILSKGFRRKPLRRGLKKKQPWDDVLTLPDTEGHLTD